MSIVTCHTEECGNTGIPIDIGDLSYRDEEGRVQQITTVVCGVCGKPITDIQR
jgi:hypothetical protein